MSGEGCYYGDCLTMYTNMESLRCTSEANIMLHVNYTSVEKI